LDAALEEIRCSHVPTDIGPLTRADKALDVWKDQERLQSACVALSAMSKNTNFDVILRACLTGMVGVLNLYLDPVLRYTWRSASVMVSKIEGKGVNHAWMLRQWILEFVHSKKLPQPNYSHSHWTVLDDEDISQFLQLQIMAHTRAIISQHPALSRLLPVRKSKKSSPTQGLLSQQSRSTQHIDGCKS
jgi:hypothetical protein